MEFKIDLQLDNRILYQCLFYLFLAAVPIINLWLMEEFYYNALYVLTVIFLGFGFSHKSKWFLFFFCTVVVFILSQFNHAQERFDVFGIRLLIFFTVTLISSNVVKQYCEIKKHENELVLALAKSLDSRDGYTAHHSENVAKYALKIAEEMKLPKEQCYAIYIGGLLHDVGKIGVPESILTKPSQLTEDEFACIKQHCLTGYEILKHVPILEKNGILDMVLYHHERYDGKGYPNGLKGEEIPLVARIISIADTFDAMTSKRVYRTAMDFDDVLNEIKRNKGTQHDPVIADIFLGILKREGANIFSIKQERLDKERYKHLF